MAITLGVHASAGSADSTTATTPARTTTPGSAIVVAAQSYSSGAAAAPTISDNKGNTYTLIGLAGGMTATPAQTETLALFYCENIAGGAGHTLTVTGPYYPSITFVELLGNEVKFDTGKSAFGMDDASPFTVGPITPSANGAAILSGLVPKSAGSGAHTLAAPGSTIEDITDVNSFFLIALGGFVQATAAAYSPSWTVADGSTQNAVGVAAFIETGGGGTAYTLTADGAAFAHTGAAAGLLRKRSAVAAGATFALTGAAATLTYAPIGGYTLSAAGASVTLTGAAATLVRGRKLAANAGAFSLTAGAGAPEIGAHTLAWSSEEEGTDPHTSAPITTQNGSRLLVTVAVANGLDVAPTDNKGNTFSRVGSRINYTLWPGYGVSVWQATDIVGGSGHTVTVQKDIDPTAEISMYVVEILNATSLDGVMSEVEYPADLVSDAVTTTGPALLYAHWWGDNGGGPHTAVARDGFTPLDSVLDQPNNFIQTASAYKYEPTAGTYSVGWDETPQQGALLGLFAFEGGSPSTNLRVDRVLAAGSGAVGLTGTGVTLTYTSVGSYSMAADGAAYSATGAAAELLAARTLAIASGAHALVGGAAALVLARELAADAAVFAAAGAATTLTAGRKLDAAVGAVTLTGADAGFPTSKVLSPDAGAVTLTGSEAALLYTPLGAYALSAATGAFTLTGGSGNLTAVRTLSAAGTTFAITGAATQFALVKRLAADAGGYSLTGATATLLYTPAGSYAMPAAPGAFATVGAAATLVYTPAAAYTLTAGTAVYALDGGSAGWQRATRLAAESTTYIVTGLPAGLFYALPKPPLVSIIATRTDSFADGPVYRPANPNLIAKR